MATTRKTTDDKGGKATKVAPPTDIEQGGPEAAAAKDAEAKAQAQAEQTAELREALKQAGKPKGKSKASARDPEGLNTRKAFPSTRVSQDPPTYDTLNGRWREIKVPVEATGDLEALAADPRHSAKTPWALMRLAVIEDGKQVVLDEPVLVDFIEDSDTAFVLAAALDGRTAMPAKHPQVRDAEAAAKAIAEAQDKASAAKK